MGDNDNKAFIIFISFHFCFIIFSIFSLHFLNNAGELVCYSVNIWLGLFYRFVALSVFYTPCFFLSHWYNCEMTFQKSVENKNKSKTQKNGEEATNKNFTRNWLLHIICEFSISPTHENNTARDWKSIECGTIFNSWWKHEKPKRKKQKRKVICIYIYIKLTEKSNWKMKNLEKTKCEENIFAKFSCND